MRYASIKGNDATNGEGISVSLWTQGCPHRCKGCHNQETWDINGGHPYTQETEDKIMELLTAHGVTRNLSVLGGEPLLPANTNGLIKLFRRVKREIPSCKIWLWTGYTWEDIQTLGVIPYVDVLIDGKFILEDRDIRLAYRGSPNQRVIDVQKSLDNMEIVLKGVDI